MKKKLLLLVLLITCGFAVLAQQNTGTSGYTVQSPDGKIKATIDLKDKIIYAVSHENDVVVAPSTISLQLSSGETLGANPRLRNSKRNTVNQSFKTPFYKRAAVENKYNELVLNFRGDYSVTFRAYDDGVAYRFATSKKKGFNVKNEEATFNFAADHQAIVPYVKQEKKTSIEEQFNNSFENTYTRNPLSALDPERLAFLPLVVDVGKGKKVAITEADLESYPGMYLINKNGKHALTGVFPAYPKRVVTTSCKCL